MKPNKNNKKKQVEKKLSYWQLMQAEMWRFMREQTIRMIVARRLQMPSLSIPFQSEVDQFKTGNLSTEQQIKLLERAINRGDDSLAKKILEKITLSLDHLYLLESLEDDDDDDREIKRLVVNNMVDAAFERVDVGTFSALITVYSDILDLQKYFIRAEATQQEIFQKIILEQKAKDTGLEKTVLEIGDAETTSPKPLSEEQKRERDLLTHQRVGIYMNIYSPEERLDIFKRAIRLADVILVNYILQRNMVTVTMKDISLLEECPDEDCKKALAQHFAEVGFIEGDFNNFKVFVITYRKYIDLSVKDEMGKTYLERLKDVNMTEENKKYFNTFLYTFDKFEKNIQKAADKFDKDEQLKMYRYTEKTQRMGQKKSVETHLKKQPDSRPKIGSPK